GPRRRAAGLCGGPPTELARAGLFQEGKPHTRPLVMKWPRIRSRRTTKVSPWMSIVAREVEFSRGEKPQIYHAVEQADYIAIVALTQGGKIPLVRQYRPALEAF